MITGNEDISIGGEDVPNKSRLLNVNLKALRFAHKFAGGETAINLGSLVMPGEISTWSNPSASEIAAANLLATSANLIIKSSTGAELFEGVDFVVTSNSGLAFINGYSPQPGEIIVGRFSLPAANVLVGDAKDYKKTVAVTAGQTIVSVGFEYKVNENPTQQMGDVRVNLNGISRLLRNVGNATAAPLADGNYEEYDPTGSGYSTAIRLNNPIAADGFIIFEGGLALASSDVKVFGAIDRLGSIVTKLAEDAAQGFHGDNDLTRYLTVMTSEVERKTFGDLLLASLNRVTELENGKHVLSGFINGAVSWPGSTNQIITWTGFDADRSRGISLSGTNITFTKKGIYKVTLSARYTSDVWFKHFMKNAAGTIIGDAAWTGGSNGPGTLVFNAYVDSPQVCTLYAYGSIGGMSLQVPAPTGSPEGQLTRTVTLTIEEM